MQLTLQADYAIRIVDCLSRHDRRVEAKRIALETGVTQRYTLKILHTLVKCGLVRSFQGADGGYLLAKPGGEISLLEVIEAASGPIEIGRCAPKDGVCTNPQGRCRFHDAFDKVNALVRRQLAQETF